MLRTLFGVDRKVKGLVRVAGKAVELNSPIDSIKAGLALVPEDRKQQGLIIEMSVRENTSLASLRREKRAAGFLNKAKERSLATE